MDIDLKELNNYAAREADDLRSVIIGAKVSVPSALRGHSRFSDVFFRRRISARLKRWKAS